MVSSLDGTYVCAILIVHDEHAIINKSLSTFNRLHETNSVAVFVMCT